MCDESYRYACDNTHKACSILCRNVSCDKTNEVIYSQLPHGLTLQLPRLPPKCIRKAFKNCSKVQTQRTPPSLPRPLVRHFSCTRETGIFGPQNNRLDIKQHAHTCTCMLPPPPGCIRRRRGEINFRRRRQRSRSCKTTPSCGAGLTLKLMRHS